MIATVPVKGLVHVFTPGTIPLYGVTNRVIVHLGCDGEEGNVGSLTFDLFSSVVNPRATEMTYLLTGAYIQVMGEAMFDVHNEDLLTDALEEVR